jgi:protein TonB
MRWIVAVPLAFLVSAFFFLALPVANVLLWGSHAPQEEQPKAPQEIEVLVQPPKPDAPKRVVRQIVRPKNSFNMNASSHASQALRGFSMDLSLAGAGDGEGVAVGGGGMGNVVYEAGEVDQEAVPLREVPAQYPARAQKQRVSGVVKVYLVIDTQGQVSEASVLSVSPPGYGFEAEALKAIRQFRFSPAQIGGYPVAQKATKTFNFTM